MHLDRVVIADPSGNQTAIVFGDVADDAARRRIDAAIRSQNPNVEQVLFALKKEDGTWHGQMAGGEFCGNAARSLGFVLAAMECCSSATFTMSGIECPVTVSVEGDSATLIMKSKIDVERRFFYEQPIQIVHMEGISHVIFPKGHQLFNFLKAFAEKKRDETIIHVLEDLGLDNKPAAGLIFVDDGGAMINITPYVRVSAIRSLYAETACASGSIALAGVLEEKNLAVRQPSGEILNVKLQKENDFIIAHVGGIMKIISDGPLEIPGPPAANDSTPEPAGAACG